MRRVIPPILALCVCALAVVAAQQPQGPGQLRPRPGSGREPEFPAPKITDYKPKSTLVVPEHPVPRAKFPVIDLHGHPPALTSPQMLRRARSVLAGSMLWRSSGASCSMTRTSRSRAASPARAVTNRRRPSLGTIMPIRCSPWPSARVPH